MGDFWLVSDKMHLKQRIESFHKYLENEWDWTHPVSWKVSVYRRKRSLSQNDLFHLWMREATKFLQEHSPAAKDLTEEDLKDILKARYLGTRDIVYGKVCLPGQPRKTSTLPPGEMFEFMEQVHEWALDKGIPLTHPEDSEYMRYQKG